MFRRFTHVFVATSIAVISTATFCGGYFNTGNYNNDSQAFRLEPSDQITSDTDESFEHTDKTAYVYAGYLFTYRFLNTSTQKITDHAGSIVNYPVDGNTPKEFHSIKIGLGRAISRYVDLQLAYVQQFRQTENSTIAGVASKNTPSLIIFSSTTPASIVKCCNFPLGSVNLRSTNSASFSFINFKTLLALILTPFDFGGS